LIDEVIEKLRNGTLEGGISLCKPGSGKGYGFDKSVCDHPNQAETEHPHKG
jgi:predicted Fe-Mo cluster-binding NifX family protein